MQRIRSPVTRPWILARCTPSICRDSDHVGRRVRNGVLIACTVLTAQDTKTLQTQRTDGRVLPPPTPTDRAACSASCGVEDADHTRPTSRDDALFSTRAYDIAIADVCTWQDLPFRVTTGQETICAAGEAGIRVRYGQPGSLTNEVYAQAGSARLWSSKSVYTPSRRRASRDLEVCNISIAASRNICSVSHLAELQRLRPRVDRPDRLRA